ncbi:MAG TPA: pilus assembly protein PilP [Thermoanaerobaculia bacterium]|nr:pilus assembly protein PilP [Thermoanaerobaculia bacterium]
MKKRNFGASLLIVLAAVASVLAQTPGATSTTSTDSSATTTASDVQKTLEEILEEPTTTDAYRYDPQGRRDPFRSLIGPAPKLEPGQRPPGVPGFLIDEMKLQGIFKTRQGLTAMINGPDNKGHLLRVGDKVLDGEVIRITASSVVFRQEVNDPTRIERYREVVKDLAPTAPRR